MDKHKISALLILTLTFCLTTQAFAQTKPPGPQNDNDYDYISGFPGTAINPSGIVLYSAGIWTRTGGNQSLGGLGGGSTVAAAINAAGAVVGMSQLPDGTFHAFLWTASGGMQDLGSVLGGNSSAGAVNASGQVTGNSSTADGSITHAFFWSSGTGMVDLGTLPGDAQSSAIALNDNGEVVGAGDGVVKFKWTASSGMQALPGLGVGSSLVGVGDNGIIGGSSFFADGSQHATVWTADGVVHDLGTLPGDTISAVSYVNSSGHMTGYSARPGAKRGSGPQYDTFFWTATSGMVDLGLPHAAQHFPFAFNNHDQILVYYGNIFIWGPNGPEAFAGNGNKIPIQGILSDAGLFFGVGQRLYAPVMHVQLTSSANPSTAGESVTFTANVSSVFGPAPDGEQVTIGQGSKIVLGTASLSGGTATVSTAALKAGKHNIIATYSGDNNYPSSKSPKVVQVVTK
jgi:probable HAF family extracellular repeat protein